MLSYYSTVQERQFQYVSPLVSVRVYDCVCVCVCVCVCIHVYACASSPGSSEGPFRHCFGPLSQTKPPCVLKTSFGITPKYLLLRSDAHPAKLFKDRSSPRQTGKDFLNIPSHTLSLSRSTVVHLVVSARRKPNKHWVFLRDEDTRVKGRNRGPSEE